MSAEISLSTLIDIRVTNGLGYLPVEERSEIGQLNQPNSATDTEQQLEEKLAGMEAATNCFDWVLARHYPHLDPFKMNKIAWLGRQQPTKELAEYWIGLGSVLHRKLSREEAEIDE